MRLAALTAVAASGIYVLSAMLAANVGFGIPSDTALPVEKREARTCQSNRRGEVSPRPKQRRGLDLRNSVGDFARHAWKLCRCCKLLELTNTTGVDPRWPDFAHGDCPLAGMNRCSGDTLKRKTHRQRVETHLACQVLHPFARAARGICRTQGCGGEIQPTVHR